MIKKFKPNKLTTLMFAMLEIMVPFSTGAPIMVLLMSNGERDLSEWIGIIPTVLILLILIALFCCTINLISYPFTKHTVFLFDDHFCRDNVKVKYSDVTHIEIDSGFISRGGASEPCCINCYSDDKLLLSIKHPSLIMTFLLLRRCKNVKLKYKRIARVILLWLFAILCCVVLGIYASHNSI